MRPISNERALKLEYLWKKDPFLMSSYLALLISLILLGRTNYNFNLYGFTLAISLNIFSIARSIFIKKEKLNLIRILLLILFTVILIYSVNA